LEIKGLKAARQQLRNAVAVIYSVVVMATIIPGFHGVSTLIVIPYFLLVPGYFVMLLFRYTGILERLFYSVAWSIVILTSVYSLGTIMVIQDLPLQLVIPALTIILLAYDNFHR
jgi:hypothetical protein